MASQKSTFLFVPLEFYGQINACHGMAETLRDRGHRVVFVIDIAFKGKLNRYGFEEEWHSLRPDQQTVGNQAESMPDYINRNKDMFKESPLQIAGKFCVYGFENLCRNLMARESQYKAIIDRVKPHLILIDSYFRCPALINASTPWVRLFSAAPLLMFNNDKLPPPWSGLPTNAKLKERKEFRFELEKQFQTLYDMINTWYADIGVPPLPSGSTCAICS